MGISPQKFGDQLVELLPRLMQEISRYENNSVTSGTITCQQFLVLDQLSRRDAWTMNELVDVLDIRFSSATGMVDRLFKQGFVNRKRCTEDRRRVLVSISAQGQRVVDEVFEQKKNGIIQLFKRLNAEERQSYLDIIRKLVNSLSTAKERSHELHSQQSV